MTVVTTKTVTVPRQRPQGLPTKWNSTEFNPTPQNRFPTHSYAVIYSSKHIPPYTAHTSTHVHTRERPMTTTATTHPLGQNQSESIRLKYTKDKMGKGEMDTWNIYTKKKKQFDLSKTTLIEYSMANNHKGSKGSPFLWISLRKSQTNFLATRSSAFLCSLSSRLDSSLVYPILNSAISFCLAFTPVRSRPRR